MTALSREIGSRGRANAVVVADSAEPRAPPGAPISGTPLRSELQTLKVGALGRRAAEAGVDEAALEEAEESADPKAALIELILQCSGATEADAATSALRAELLQLKLGALGRRPIAEGVDEPLLEEAEDSEEPQASIIELILAQRARS